jgi:2-polyprenyl-3-methyl-5-hydroxy-6-metoxy-1,4-benzoquinol methylase
MTFKDHFSKQAADYAKFRPGYLRELFDYLGSIAPSRRLAWDCGTGNGQAAGALATVFNRVIATDASEKQISSAQPHERVEYRVAPAEDSGIESETLGLVMVAQALHWFRPGPFLRGSAASIEAERHPHCIRLQLVAHRTDNR